MINSLFELLETTKNKFPNKIAVQTLDSAITFKDLYDRSKNISAQIEAEHIKKQNIAVFADQSIETLLMFFGIMASGNTYVMLDPESPTERINKILENANIGFILKCDKQNQTFSLEKTEFFDENKQYFVNSANNINDNLYIVYTSGSTGTPKGVVKSHLSMLCFIESFVEEFNISSDDVFANQTLFYFDASSKDIYAMVKTGATLWLVPKSYFSFPVKLVELLNTSHTTIIDWVPSALSIVAQLNTFMVIKPKYLKKVFFVGEVFPVKYLNIWRKNLPNVEYINLYGSSEVAGIVCYFRVKGELDEKLALPMGKPIKNANVFLLDENNNLISSPNVEGEVCVTGPILAKGYYADEERTSKVFVKNPLSTCVPETMYRSGDLAVLDDCGNLVFKCRKDFQIKHMGHRVELGEIESVCSSIKDIKDCCCLYDEKHKKIVLFYSLNGNVQIVDTIKEDIKTNLPNYMIPNKYVNLDSMPKNANGKTDRTLLKKKFIVG